MLPVLGVGSIFGRTVPAIVADKAGNLNVLAFCTIVSALLGFCWIAVDSIAGVHIWSLFYLQRCFRQPTGPHCRIDHERPRDN